MLIQKGRELLRKDNLLDESAPHENKTAEELALELQQQLTVVQTRMAKLLAEQTNQNKKLQHRIEYLEARLGKYENLQIGRDEDGNIIYYEKPGYHGPKNNENSDDDDEEDDDDIDN
uniref:Cyclic nucleotide-gated channel C-terminal leucine zipper domain-containing protein n=1 Tax=Panagrolaimus sp. PS1159 TaxID=55785 RepID=A0AC35G123_9BILA